MTTMATRPAMPSVSGMRWITSTMTQFPNDQFTQFPVEWAMFDRLDLPWLWDGIGQLPRADRWQTQARSAVRDDLLTALAELTRAVIDSADGSVDAWLAANERSVARAQAMFTEIRRGDGYDLTTLSVALRQLRNLALTSVTRGVAGTGQTSSVA